jgi:hypothetical protein
VDFCVWKVRQAAAMIKMHMSENDMLDVFRFVSHFPHLIDRRFIRVEGHICDDAEKICEPGWIAIICQTQTGIDEGKTLISFGQQAKRASLPIREAGVAGKAVEHVNGHEDIIRFVISFNIFVWKNQIGDL